MRNKQNCSSRVDTRTYIHTNTTYIIHTHLHDGNVGLGVHELERDENAVVETPLVIALGLQPVRSKYVDDTARQRRVAGGRIPRNNKIIMYNEKKGFEKGIIITVVVMVFIYCICVYTYGVLYIRVCVYVLDAR